VASLISGRSAFITFSLGAHAFMMFGIDQLEAKKSREAIAIQIAQSNKPAKKPEAKVETPPRKPEPPARERRPSAPKPVEAPPAQAAPAPAATPLADLPDFGVSLSGGGDAAGFALPGGASARPGPQSAPRPTKAAPKQLSAAAAPAVVDGCADPPAKPKPRSVPQPGYTDAARAAAVEGKVRVQLSVDEAGHVVSVKLLQGLGYGLDEAALAAARQAQFEPAVRCGKPTSATFNISMRFSLT